MRRLRGIPDFIWERHSGRDREGDLVDRMSLFGPDGMELVLVDFPHGEEGTFQVEPRVFIRGIGGTDPRYFMDFSSARKFSEDYARKVIAERYVTRRTKAVKKRR